MTRILLYKFTLVLIFAISAPAIAQDIQHPSAPQNIIADTISSGSLIETDEPLYLTPDKSEIVDINSDIGSVIIGNDQHVNILVDSARRLIFVPRAPGASHVMILGKKGQVIMQRHVIVSGPKEGYVRVRKTCALSEDDNCEATQTYFCDATCHKINNKATDDAAMDQLDEGLSDSAF